MTIHHDKLAYGKLVSMKEELSEEALEKIALAIAEDEEEEDEKTIEEQKKK